MSAQVQQPIRVSYGRTTVIALFAFAIGAMGTFAIKEITDVSSAVEATAPAPTWDTGRLEAMEGRQLAETASEPVVWDAGRLEAMEGRQLAETIVEPVVWDSFMSEPTQSLIGELSHSQR
jgi:hypothetical protein